MIEVHSPEPSPRGQDQARHRLGEGDWGTSARYGVALAAVVCAAVAALPLHFAKSVEAAMVVFSTAVVGTGLAVGAGPGTVATGFSAAVVSLWFLPADGPAKAVTVGVFVASGLFVSGMAGASRRHRRECLRRTEREVATRTAELQEACAHLSLIVEDHRQDLDRLRLATAVVEHARDAVIVTEAEPIDEPGPRIQYVNPAFLRETGYSLEEVIGRSPRFLQGAGSDRAALDTIRRNLRRWKPCRVEVLNYKKDGTPFWAELEISPLADESGWYTHWIAIQRDVTQRKASEEAMRTREADLALSQAAAHLGSWRWDLTRDEVTWSEEMFRIFGVDSREFVPSNDRVRCMIHPEDRDRHAALIATAMKGERIPDFECRIVRPDGEEKTVLASGIQGRRDSGGELNSLFGTLLDVTERRRADSALRASERRWRELAEAIPALVWTCTPDGECDYLSGQWTTFTGQPEAEQLGHAWLQQVHPDDRGRLRDSWEEAVAAVTPFDDEFRIRRSDGRYHWFKSRAVPIRGDDGRVAKWFGSCTDIEVLRRTADALRASEEKLLLFVEYAPVALAMLDREMRYLFASRRWSSDYGLEGIELPGRSHYDVFPDIPDRWRAVHRRALAGEVMRSEEDRFDRRAGVTQWLRWEVRPWYASDGEVGGIVIFTEDITARRQAEELLRVGEQRLRLAVQSARIGLWDWDLRSDEVIYSTEWKAQLGYADIEIRNSLEEWRTRVHQHDLGAALDRTRRTIEGPESSQELEFRMRHKDGSWRWIFARSEVIRDETGAGVRMLGCHLDVTDRRRAEDELRASESRLKRVLEVETVGVMFWDRSSGVMTDANETFLKLMGYSRREVEEGELTWQKLTLPEHLTASRAEIQKFEVTGRVGPYEKEYLRKDGTRQWFLLAGSSLDEHTCVEFCVDISNRMAAENSVRKSEATLKAALSSMTDAVFISDATGRFVEFNDAFVTFHRFHSREELLPTLADYPAVLDVSFPDGTPAPLHAWAVPRALRGETVIEAEYHLRRKDSGESWIGSYNFAPIRNPGGQIIGSVVVGRDITRRKLLEQELLEREARLSAILGCAADAIISIDRTGGMLSANPAVEQMFGYTPAELLGRNVSILMAAPYRDEHDGYLDRYFETGVSKVIGIGREVRARRKDGAVFPVELAVGEIDHLQQFVGILRDITRRKELEREVVEVASLEQRRIGEDLHDSVGQELTALSLLTANLIDTARSDPNLTLVAGRVADGLRRCQRELRIVIRGLLPVPIDSEGLMAALDDLADRTRQDHGVECTFDCPVPVKVSDNLAATHLYLIAQEAVHNAVKHARPRSIRVALAADPGLTLRVADDGIGMPPEAPSSPGWGVRIMENRAALLGARLRIEAGAPSGTVVTCRLPERSSS